MKAEILSMDSRRSILDRSRIETRIASAFGKKRRVRAA